MTTEHKPWAELSSNAHDRMADLGSFGPTTNIQAREVKGLTIGNDGDTERAYWSSEDLRKIAAACTEVADWLDKRAEQDTGAAA